MVNYLRFPEGPLRKVDASRLAGTIRQLKLRKGSTNRSEKSGKQSSLPEGPLRKVDASRLAGTIK